MRIRANPQDILLSRLSDGRQRDLASHVPNNPLFPRSRSRSRSRSFRYGFNGKEVDSEINGNGNAYDFGARTYDARLGRWWSVDPGCFTQPDQSTYKAFKNNGIIFSDPNGETEWLRVIVKDNYGHMFAFRVPISDDVMTDGVKHRSKIFVFGQPWGEHVWNEWYDFETTVTYTIDKNGELIGPAVLGETKILFSNGAKDTDSFNIDDDKYGDTKDPDGVNNLQGVGEVQNSGFFFTGGNGDYATKTKGKFDGETVDIADFLTAVTAFTKDPSSLPDVKKALGPAEFAGLISEWTSTVDEAIKSEKKKAASTNQTKTENDSIWVCYDLHYIIGKSGAVGFGRAERVLPKDTTGQVVKGNNNKKIVPCN